MPLIWIGIALALAVVEVATVALFAAFAALGAVGAAVAAYLGADLLVQGVVFGAVSLAGILLIRPWLLRYLKRRSTPEMLSGASGMVGMTAIVVDAIAGPESRGHVRVAGENWPALTADGTAIKAGRIVRIIDIDKATLVVADEGRNS